MSEEREALGYCENCGEPFYKPELNCPFCRASNKRMDQQIRKMKERSGDQLIRQMAENRAWAENNRAEVQDMVDAIHEQNLKEMKKKFLPGSK